MSTSHDPPGATHEAVMEALCRCYDPCCRERAISVVDMGLIDQIRTDGRRVDVDVILTTGWCPFSMHLVQMMEDEVGRIDGVEEVSINIVWHTPWTPDRLSEDARKKLQLPMEQLIPLREARLVREAAQHKRDGGAP